MFKFLEESPLDVAKKVLKTFKEKPMIMLYSVLILSSIFDIIKYVILKQGFKLFMEVLLMALLIYAINRFDTDK